MTIIPNANGTYTVRLGRGAPRQTFKRKKDAVEYELKLMRDRQRNRAGLQDDPGAITYEKLAELYEDTYTGKSGPWVHSILKHSIKTFGKMYVRQIRPEDVSKWLNGLDYAPATKTHALTYLRTVLALGVEWGYLEKSPAASRFITVPGRGRATPIQPFESWQEVEALAEQAGRSAAIIQFVCATGLRPGEWGELRWSDLDLREKTCHVRGTKTAAANRMIPLSKKAIGALFAIPRPLKPDAHVFVGKKGLPIPLESWRVTIWKRALEDAGLAPRPPYQMRHTFATLALEAGVPIDSLSKLMGHESIEITLRYYAKWTRPMLDNARSILDTFGEKEEADGRADTSV